MYFENCIPEANADLLAVGFLSMSISEITENQSAWSCCAPGCANIAPLCQLLQSIFV